MSDDPGLSFRMEEPQILEALTSKTVFELSVSEKIKIMLCLMYQILSFASVRDVIDDRFMELTEAKMELRSHQIAENKRQKAVEEAEKQKRKEMRLQKKEEELKAQENKKQEEDKGEEKGASKPEEKPKKEEKPVKKDDILPDAHLTERQRLAIQSQKEKEEKRKLKEEELKREEAYETEQCLLDRIADLQKACGISFLGRDRAYRRFWALETLPGLFVEHDDDTVGPCLEEPTRVDAGAGPMDEDAAMKKVAEILDARSNKSPDEKGSSDKENDQADDKKVMDVTKTYSKKGGVAGGGGGGSGAAPSVLKQKVLSTKNGTLDVEGPASAAASSTAAEAGPADDDDVVILEVKGESEGDSKKLLAGSSVAEESADKKPQAPPIPWGACLADQVNCPVHSTILPKTHWSYYCTTEELDQLIEALNSRGFRESELKDRLLGEKERLAKNFRKFGTLEMDTKLSAGDAKGAVQEEEEEETASFSAGESSIASSADLQLRDQILELEEKVFLGTLGTLKVRDRTTWQKAIQEGSYDRQCESMAWGGKSVQDTPFESRLQSAGASRDQVSEAPRCTYYLESIATLWIVLTATSKFPESIGIS